MKISKLRFLQSFAILSLLFAGCDSGSDDQEDSGVLVNAPSALLTTESGSSIEFTVQLSSAPSSRVVIEVVSSDTSEGTVDPATLEFNADNWNTAQTVKVTGVDDINADGDQPYDVTIRVKETDDESLKDFTKTLKFKNIDNDEDSVISDDNLVNVSPRKNLMTTESGDTASFELSLTSKPSSDVTISLNATPSAEARLDVTKLVFTPDNWNVPQKVLATGLDDSAEDGNQIVTVSFDLSSADSSFDKKAITPLQIVNVDNEIKPLVNVLYENLVTDEFETTDSFYVGLSNKPAYNVKVTLRSTDPTEAVPMTSTITLTPDNYYMAECIVQGIDDDDKDGSKNYKIVIDKVESDDPSYTQSSIYDLSMESFDFKGVNGTNHDNDDPDTQNGLVIKQISSPSPSIKYNLTPTARTSEDGTLEASYTIELKSAPKAGHQVFVAGVVTDPSEGSIYPSAFYFDSTNWNEPQKFIISGRDDNEADGNVIYGVYFISASSDLSCSDLESDLLILENIDDEAQSSFIQQEAAVIINKAHSVLYTSEEGMSKSFRVALNSQPSDEVTIKFKSSDTTEGKVTSGATLVFTPLNWNIFQSVMVTGQADNQTDGDINYTVNAKVTSNDANYNNIEVTPVEFKNFDSEDTSSSTSTTTSLSNINWLSINSSAYSAGNPIEIKSKFSLKTALSAFPTAPVTFCLKISDPSIAYFPYSNTGDPGLMCYNYDKDGNVMNEQFKPYGALNWLYTTITLRSGLDLSKSSKPFLVTPYTLESDDEIFSNRQATPIQFVAISDSAQSSSNNSSSVTSNNSGNLLYYSSTPDICNSIAQVSPDNPFTYSIHLNQQPKSDVKVVFKVGNSDVVSLKENGDQKSKTLTFKPENYAVDKDLVIYAKDISEDSVSSKITVSVTTDDPDFAAAKTQLCNIEVKTLSTAVATTMSKTQRLRIMAANTTTTGQVYADPGMNMFYAMDPDIILIQEFALSYKTVISGLKEHFGKNYNYFVGNGRIGNGIITKKEFPILWTKSISSNQNISDRQWDAALIDIPGDKDLLAISLHLSKERHLNEFPALADWIKELTAGHDYYVVIGGDFNTSSYTDGVYALDDVLTTKFPYPHDQNGNYRTNASRRKHYDWVLADPELHSYSTPVVIGSDSYAYGYVLDSRVQNPISDIAPVQVGDSDADDMQHMPVIRDFLYEY